MYIQDYKISYLLNSSLKITALAKRQYFTKCCDEDYSCVLRWANEYQSFLMLLDVFDRGISTFVSIWKAIQRHYKNCKWSEDYRCLTRNLERILEYSKSQKEESEE